ncbi:hypothetical protein KHA90_25290, partial [Flavobacterium psychroterrae]
LLSQLSKDNFPHEVRNYKITANIEAKIKVTLEKIQATSWGGFTAQIVDSGINMENYSITEVCSHEIAVIRVIESVGTCETTS